jgi:hypothetical protein
LSNRQIDSNAVGGVIAPATVVSGVPDGQVMATLFQPATSMYASVRVVAGLWALRRLCQRLAPSTMAMTKIASYKSRFLAAARTLSSAKATLTGGAQDTTVLNAGWTSGF